MLNRKCQTRDRVNYTGKPALPPPSTLLVLPLVSSTEFLAYPPVYSDSLNSSSSSSNMAAVRTLPSDVSKAAGDSVKLFGKWETQECAPNYPCRPSD